MDKNINNLSIYVPEEKKDIVQKAKEMGENLSPIVLQAIEEYVERKEQAKKGFTEINIEVGTRSGKMGESDDIKNVKLYGRELASYRQYHGELSSHDDRGTDYTLYQTQKGKFLLHQEYWSRWQGEDSSSSYDIYESLDDVEAPYSLISDAKEELGEDPSIFLDV